MRKSKISTPKLHRRGHPSENSLVRTLSHTGSDELAEGIAPPLSVLPALREVLATLTTLRSVVVTIALALECQKAGHDTEIADTLQRCVSDEMDRMVWRLKEILGDAPHPGQKDSRPPGILNSLKAS
jgi:hypothetical protein